MATAKELNIQRSKDVTELLATTKELKVKVDLIIKHLGIKEEDVKDEG